MATTLERMGAGIPAQHAKLMNGSYSTVAAAGSVIGDATAISQRASNCVVTAADGTKGVSISGEVGDEYLIFNNAGSALNVYPPSGEYISISGTGLGTVSAAVSLAAQKSGLYRKISATQWISVLSA